jgi:hypothetical protein
MKRLTLLPVLALLAACGDTTTDPVGVLVGPQMAVASASHEAADLIEATFPGAPAGASVLGATMTRNGNGVHVRMHATAPVPNTATMWAVVFNGYQSCVQMPGEAVACGLDDLFREGVNASLLRAGGRAIGGSPLTMTGNVREGDTSEALFGPGLMNAQTAEIHFILRLHGAPIPGIVDEQIHTLEGECVDRCADVGAAIFLGA